MSHNMRSKKESKNRDTMRRRRRQKEELLSLVKDVAVASLIVLIVMVSLYVYSGFIWPPMVVVESGSMMHGDDSAVGIIDTGDLTLVKKIYDRHDVVTYVEAHPDYNTTGRSHKGYKAYGDYGDVIIYKKNGLEGTPVIHRAIMWVEYNETGSIGGRYCADIPDLGLYCQRQYTLVNADYRGRDLVIDFNPIFNQLHARHEGFLTHGDNNHPAVDQAVLQDSTGKVVSPVKAGWVVGKSEGELPWFGVIKLLASGTISSDDVPPNSWTGLIGSIVLIITIPLAIDIILHLRNKRKKSADGTDEEDEEEDQGSGEEEDDERDEKVEDLKERGGEKKDKRRRNIHKRKHGSKARREKKEVTFDIDDELENEDR